MEHDGDARKEELNVPLLATSVEEVIEQSIGRINLTQITQALLVSIATIFDSQQTFISVFAHAQPSWHCSSNSTSCTPNSNICNLSRGDWVWDSGNVHTSIISEWDLECASSFVAGLPATSYFIGCFLGGLLLSTLADSSLGRKKLLFISSLVMSLSALASAFSPNFWIYSGFRFLSGVGRASIAISVLVLLTERVGKRWRGQIAMVGFISFSMGIISLTGIAYVTRFDSWRTLYLWTSVPGIICSGVCYFFIFESPRWLYMQGRDAEAVSILQRLGCASEITPFLSNSVTTPSKILKSTNPFASLNVLIQRKWAVKRLLVSMVLSFGIGLMYFGMFLGVGNLGFNIYLTSVFNALLSMSSYLLTFLFWIQRYNRRSSLLGFCAIGGATSILFSIIGRGNYGLLLTFELVSLFCACMAYNIALMYVVELFPTCVRNSASSLVRLAMILGSVFDPMLIQLGRLNIIYSYGVFGLAMLFSGFVVLYLPETKGKVLCDTMEEQEFNDSIKEPTAI